MMFKKSTFVPFIMSVSLILAFPTEIVERAIPRTVESELVARTNTEVLSDYESLTFNGIPGVADNMVLTSYNQISYTGFGAVHKVGTGTLLQQIRGDNCAVGGNGSTLAVQSEVTSFKANYGYFGCFIDADGASPGVSCTVQVKAYDTSNTALIDMAGCAYNGAGPITQCTFPSTWTNVAKLEFNIVASALTSTTGTGVGGLVGLLFSLLGLSSLGPIGNVGFILDDFDANFSCAPGKTNAATGPGLCV